MPYCRGSTEGLHAVDITRSVLGDPHSPDDWTPRSVYIKFFPPKYRTSVLSSRSRSKLLPILFFRHFPGQFRKKIFKKKKNRAFWADLLWTVLSCNNCCDKIANRFAYSFFSSHINFFTSMRNFYLRTMRRTNVRISREKMRYSFRLSYASARPVSAFFFFLLRVNG